MPSDRAESADSAGVSVDVEELFHHVKTRDSVKDMESLRKALGQSKKAFKEGIDEGETDSRSKLNSVDDEALFDEARRRADAKKIDR